MDSDKVGRFLRHSVLYTVYITNSRGPSMLPCGIPLITGIKFEYSEFTLTLCFLCSKNTLAYITVASSIPYEPS